MSTVQVNATLPSTADQDAITAAIASLKKSLPFLISLEKADRRAITKPSAKAETFMKDALDVAMHNPAMLPAAFNVPEMQNGLSLFEYLVSLQLQLRQVMQEVDDTVKQVGNQVYTSARAVYASASSQFSSPALQVAADHLGKHFGRRPKAKPAGESSSSPAPTSSASASSSRTRRSRS